MGKFHLSIGLLDPNQLRNLSITFNFKFTAVEFGLGTLNRPSEQLIKAFPDR